MRALPFIVLMLFAGISVAETRAKILYLTHYSANVAEGDLVDVSKIGSGIRITLGQRNVLTFDQRGARLVNPRSVQAPQKRPAVTLQFSAHPTEKGVVMLDVKSAYPRIVRYRIEVRARGSRDFHETKTLPLNPDLSVLEGWKGPFEELVLFDFHLTDEKPPKTA